jgi:hypothetical protein
MHWITAGVLCFIYTDGIIIIIIIIIPSHRS